MDGLIPNVNDVLFGRGTAINAHPGNRQFRSLVETHKPTFMTAQYNKDKNEKRAIAIHIFTAIQSMQPPGRFLMEHRTTSNAIESNDNDLSSSNDVHPSFEKKTWKCVDPEKALDKILKRLRERDYDDVVISPQPQIRVVERGIHGLHSIMLSTPQPGVRTDSSTYSLNRWGNHTDLNAEYAMHAYRFQSQLSHQLQQHSITNTPTYFNTSPAEQRSSESSSICDFAPMDPKATSENNFCQQHFEVSANQEGTTTDEKSMTGNDICQYLEGSGLDFKGDSLLQDTTSQVEPDTYHHLHLSEYTLRQWITASNPSISLGTAASTQLSNKQAQYIQSALLIALKLTECLMEAENDEKSGHGNPIPLASIAPENVLIRARKTHRAGGELDEDDGETIEFVWVMSFVGDESATGTVTSRLFAVGKILYELFSAKEFMMDDNDNPECQHNTVSIDSISFIDKSENGHRAQKRTNLISTPTDRGMSNYIASLELNGVPWSLCTLVTNLLECRYNSFCKDDAYASFDDLHVDLQLMVDNPSCFLDNICVGNVMSKLVLLDKLYGRDEEVRKLDELFQRHITGQKVNGAIISGEAGVGKSTLAGHMKKLTDQCNGYFLSAKFEQNQMSLKPLSTIIYAFDALCEMVFDDFNNYQLTEIEEELKSAIGSQPNLLGVVANLRKLMPSCSGLETSANSCVDSAVSTRYLLGELLRVISSHSRPITFVIDDIQFADQASLLLVGNMLFNAHAQGAPVFFCLCHRDDEMNRSVSFNAWLTSIKMFALEPIKVVSLTPLGVNSLISEALHLSPRLARPLSFVLHHKTRGNPLFLRQLLDSLTEQGFIYMDLKRRKWAWDLDKIIELEISECVLALLTSDVQRLPIDLQFGLQVAACFGSKVSESIINYLSVDLRLDLKDILRQVSQKGFMIDVAGSKTFRFAHDKIQQAAYELMPEQQRRENHMRFGLAICTQTLANSVEDEELFFAAVNQINQGGPTAVHEPSQKSVFAQLNLKAGRRSIKLSDYNTAFMLFQHGISFLGDDDWTLNYQLSLDLYDAVAEAALILNKLSLVTLYTDCVVMHAKSFDDKLHCLCTAAQALGIANRVEDSFEASFAILVQFGETLPRAMGDTKLRTDIDLMNYYLQSSRDDIIFSMPEDNDTNMISLIGLYSYLTHLAHYRRPWLFGSLSLRMVQLTTKSKLSAMSPLAFAYFGSVLVTAGCITDGCRLGKLALTLVERRGSMQYKSRVIFFVYNTILWASEPLQILVEAHLKGHKAGQLSGDIHYSISNLLVILQTFYVAGQSFDIVQKNIKDFMLKLDIHDVKVFFKYPILLLSQIMVLKEGLHMSSVAHMDNRPSEGGILADAGIGLTALTQGKMNNLTRAFLFRKLDDAVQNIDISGEFTKSYVQLTPLYLFGYFFEGLTSFLLARQSNDSTESVKWIERGHSVLANMRCWSEHSQWNWENKTLLLEAESLHSKGEFDRAGPFYDKAIRSAREHKFIHEEAIASELAGNFFYERGFRQKSYSYLVHSVDCYEKWGADAVAKRVEAVIGDYFGDDIDQLGSCEDTSLEHIFASSEGSRRKRQEGGAL